MKIQVRRGVFETNSSSTHTLSLINGADWDMFIKGDMVMENFMYRPKLVDKSTLKEDEIFSGKEDQYLWDYDYITYEAFINIYDYSEDYIGEYKENDVKDSNGIDYTHIISYMLENR